MSKPPHVSGHDVVAALRKVGFYVRRQRGNHVVLRRDAPFVQTTVPNHHELDTATVRAILHQVSLSFDDFTELV